MTLHLKKKIYRTAPLGMGQVVKTWVFDPLDFSLKQDFLTLKFNFESRNCFIKSCRFLKSGLFYSKNKFGKQTLLLLIETFPEIEISYNET